MKTANDDDDARTDAIQRRAAEIQAYIVQPGRTKDEGEAVLAEMRDLVAELQQIGRARTARLRALQRQLGISTRPKLTVVTDESEPNR